MTIAFNVAPQHFDDALILNDVGTIFDGSPIKLTQIVLEVTERHEVKNLTSTRRTIAALQGLGCKVAIDDVGTGHSGLSYILKLGVDIIKIDKIFVEAIETEGHSKAIIETLIDLAKNMRMEIIAEGVETFDQVTYLRERGISAAQGYVFAPPLPASVVPATARRHGSGGGCAGGVPGDRPGASKRAKPPSPAKRRSATVNGPLTMTCRPSMMPGVSAHYRPFKLKLAFTPLVQFGSVSGGVLVSPRRKLLVAIAIGVVLAGPPVAALNIWLSGLVERQARDELELSARRHMALAEARIARADRGARRSCRPRRRFLPDRQRRGAATGDVRHHPGQGAFDRRSRWPDAVHRCRQSIGSAQRSFRPSRCRRQPHPAGGDPPRRPARSNGSGSAVPATGSANGIAALMPAELFVPQVSTGEGRSASMSQMVTGGGALIAEAGVATPAEQTTTILLVITIASERYALKATTSASPAGLASNQR